MKVSVAPNWPVLRFYDSEHQSQIAMPMGGIGTGTVSLGGRGQLRDWEVMNRPAKGYNGGNALFVIRSETDDGTVALRAAEGALTPPYDGAFGATAAYHGVPRFRECLYAAAYPFAQVLLSDPDVPLGVRIEAFNPFVPGDANVSGMPMAIMRFVLINPADSPVSATVCGTLRNFVGEVPDSEAELPAHSNEYRSADLVRGLFMSATGLADTDVRFGTLAMATTAEDTSHWLHWPDDRWGGGLLSFWDTLTNSGRLDALETVTTSSRVASLAAHLQVPAHGEASVTFLLAWHFPNRVTWTPTSPEKPTADDIIGNYYATQYEDAWQVAESAAPRLAELEERSLDFCTTFLGTDLPEVVKEAALFNLSTLRSNTCFRTPGGHLYGWEGCCDCTGCCYGSCTHVWNYEQATAHLFGALARGMREVEFLHATDDRGHMSFRVSLPLARALDHGLAAADGQMGCIVKAYREWQLSGDDVWLEHMWPAIRRALSFAWIDGGWDADADGVMEGCQHNTLDVEYYGPNPLMGTWYLAALRAGEEMARQMGDAAFAERCAALYRAGREWIDANLFNGEYYEQHIVPLPTGSRPAPGLRSTMGASDLSQPDFQVGPGCLVDQMVGQVAAHVCNLGHILDPQHVRQTLASIRRYNGRQALHSTFNPMRTFALNDEQALLMCSYPHGGRPQRPVPYYAEVMTGFEYTAAVHMLFEGMTEQGIEAIGNIRNRYDGRRRNPFDEAECGHHYARAMASWGAVIALTGFRYSAVTHVLAFRSQPATYFWSTGHAWGTCRVEEIDTHRRATLAVHHGKIGMRTLELSGYGMVTLDDVRVIAPGHALTVEVQPVRDAQ